MGAITYDKIKIEGDIELLHLHKMSVTMQGNQHAYAYIEGEISERCTEERYETKNSFIYINCFDEKSNSFKSLFVGLVNRITYKNINESSWAEIHLVSATKLLDQERKSCSFQNVALTYQDIAKQVVQQTGSADCICTTGESAIAKPLIQYQETDWEFLSRIASHSNTAIYPDVKTKSPRLWVGFPNEVINIEVDGIDYEVGICEEYLDSELPSEVFIYYEIELDADYDIGTGVVFQGRKWWIEQKVIELKQGILVFRYRLRLPYAIQTAKKYQSLFAGMSILGTVMAVDGETLKLHLDIDKQQKAGEAYSYEWTPDTGSAMYCMPKVGTTVSLYFASSDEQAARAVSCVRENGGSCPQMSDPNKRGLTTEYGKSLVLNPEDMGLKSEANEVDIIDGQGISIITMKKVSVTSKQKIKLIGKKVTLVTPKEIQMARK